MSWFLSDTKWMDENWKSVTTDNKFCFALLFQISIVFVGCCGVWGLFVARCPRLVSSYDESLDFVVFAKKHRNVLKLCPITTGVICPSLWFPSTDSFSLFRHEVVIKREESTNQIHFHWLSKTLLEYPFKIM